MGTVAGNITQTVSFYNTTGVIEKEHNLYYCPKSSNNTNIALEWLRLFETVATKRSDYTNIVISQWSPEDRTLTIEGRIEHFRYRNSSKTINYMIVTEVITGSSIYDPYVEVYRTGYFITGARQNGVNSVTLDVEPDHFTNTFYLHNSVVGYLNDNIFRNVLKNTYVERQHYDRVSITENWNAYYVDDAVVSGTGLTINRTITKYNSNKIVRVIVDRITDENYEVIPNVVQVGSIINAQTDTTISVLIVVNLPAGYSGQTVHVTLRAYYIESIEQLNLPLFANYEETFRYRRQYRDKRDRILYPLTEEEKNIVKSQTSWSLLSSALKEKILKQSIAVYHCTLKNNKLITPYKESGGYIHKGNYLTYPYSAVSKQMPDVFNINCVVPEEFRYYENDIKKVFKYFAIREETTNRLYVTYNTMNQLTEQDKYPDYIASCFITKDDEVLSRITFEDVYKPGTADTVFCPVVNDVKLTLGTTDPDTPLGGEIISGYHIAVLPKSDEIEEALAGSTSYSITEPASGRFGVKLYYGTSGETLDVNLYLISSINSQRINLNLEDEVLDVADNYFEPILTFNPYSFYSISYLGNIEVPLNKNMYYLDTNIYLDYIISITDSMKISVIPSYNIEGRYLKQYTESLTLTLNNEVIFASEMLDQYLIQNKAQMKNQYAVNDTNLAKNLGTSAVGGFTTGLTTGMMTGNPLIGLGAGLIGAGAGAITSTISWAVNDKEIALNQKSKLADVGNLPNNLKQTGTDISTDISIGEMGLYLNHYSIDEISYNNICKYLERYGYLINIYDVINVYNRKGWNYVKLIDMEFNIGLSEDAEESIRQIFINGVTLLHIPSYLHNDSVHNYESSIER